MIHLKLLTFLIKNGSKLEFFKKTIYRLITNPRIIARIDIKGTKVVKGIKFEGQKVYSGILDAVKDVLEAYAV